MQIRHTTLDGCVVVSLAGQIDLFTAPRIRRFLVKELAEQPWAVICDLSGVEVFDPRCATVFSAATHPSSHWPTTRVLLCGASPAVAAVLCRLAVPRFLPLCDTVEDALDEALAQPPYLRDQLRLSSAPAAPATARRFVREVCSYWRPALPDLDVVDQAALLASELVTNALLHARPPIGLRLELHGDRLRIAVHDGSPRLLRRVSLDPEAERGRGLQVVDGVAGSWGVHPHPAGGKVVWCALDL